MTFLCPSGPWLLSFSSSVVWLYTDENNNTYNNNVVLVSRLVMALHSIIKMYCLQLLNKQIDTKTTINNTYEINIA